MEQYDFSIVIVSYNTLELTKGCLASIKENSSGLAIQLIVVDNNSQDGSVRMIKTEFPDVLLLENTKNKGFAAANNQGFNVCRGKFILLLNSDTIVLGDVLKASVDYMENHPKVGAMGCQVLNADFTIQDTCYAYPTLLRLFIMTLAIDRLPGLSGLDQYVLRDFARDKEREVEVIPGCFLLIRKHIVETIGGLDEQFFFFGEEADWCKRIREAGWILAFSPENRIIHYGGGSVNKLEFMRDVMLTSATVKLHRKHGGIVAAICAYLILMCFNLSRAVLWSMLSIFIISKKGRAKHFVKVTKAYRSCWPRGDV